MGGSVLYPHAEVVVLVTVQSRCEMGRVRSSDSGEPALPLSHVVRGAPTPLPQEVALGSPPSQGNVSPQPQG